MRTFIILSLLPCLIAASQVSHSPASVDVPNPAAVESFVPKKFKILNLAQGELNRDGKPDYALVVERAASDTKPAARRLLIIVSDADNGLKLAQEYWRFIPLPNAANEDPFSYIVIRDGLIEVKLNPANAGRSHVTYTFKPEGRRFVLDTFQRYQVKPATGMFNETMYDVTQGKQQTTSGSMSSPRHLKKTINFKPKQTWTPCRIDDPFSFEP